MDRWVERYRTAPFPQNGRPMMSFSISNGVRPFNGSSHLAK